MSDKTREKIFMAIGEASMCWAPKPTGVFDSTAAQKIGERLVADLSRHEATEPLAVLADRKGMQKVEVYAPANEDPLWYIFWYDFENGTDIDQTPIKAPTYPACEAKARAFLMGLPDKGEIK